MKQLLIIGILIFSQCCYTQNSQSYKVYQVKDSDSINGHISKIVEYDANGRKTFEENINYRISQISFLEDSRTTYIYKDTTLVAELTEYPRKGTGLNDSSKTLYQYKNNLLVKEIHYEFNKSRIHKNELYEDCFLDESDFETVPTWKKSAEIIYSYDSKGRKIEYNAPELHWNKRQNRYLFYYNEDNQLTKEVSLSNDEIILTTYYDYLDNGFDYSRDWEQRQNIQKKSDWPNKYEKRFFYDEKGQLIKKTEPEVAGIRGISTINFFYDKNGRLLKKERFGVDGKKQITHYYIYSK